MAFPTSKLGKRNWANAAVEINPIADAIENKSMRFITGSSDHHPIMRTLKLFGMMPYQTQKIAAYWRSRRSRCRRQKGAWAGVEAEKTDDEISFRRRADGFLQSPLRARYWRGSSFSLKPAPQENKKSAAV